MHGGERLQPAASTNPAGLRFGPPIAGALTAALAAPALMAAMSPFDGGITASSATFSMHGLLPYRDYWLLYGPLSGWLVAPFVATFGPSPFLIKALGLLVFAGQAAAAFAILRGWTSTAIALLVSVTTAVVAAVIAPQISAWSLAMLFGLLGLLASGRLGRPLLGGILIGLAFLSRLDVGAAGLLAALCLPERRATTIGFAIGAGPVTAMLLLLVPFDRLVEQVIWYPLVGPRQFRGLPAPDLLSLDGLLVMPAVIASRAIVLASVVRLLIRRDRPLPMFASMTVLAALAQLQGLGRADVSHLIPAAAPGLMLVAAWCRPPALRRGLALATASALTCVPLIAVTISGHVKPPSQEDAVLQEAAAIVRGRTDRTASIFVGLTSNRYMYWNPLVAYYLADRRPGTRTTMYNPGVTTTEARQRDMVEELEASATDLLILERTHADYREEENASRFPGSDALDRYIAARFEPLCDLGVVVVMVRRSADASRSGCDL